jgi:BirA family transcriptional regulator, biotin operon repressor / biotin---[acetyl-CoA-carboxylase] ligase
LDEVPSTNNYATHLIPSGKVVEGTVVLTFRQTMGKGNGKNVWESEDFKNLTFSLILFPDFLPASRQFLISQVVSLGLFDFIAGKTTGASIKWPNDLLVESKKIAGILIENTVSGANLLSSVAGIGININQLTFPGHLRRATSLALSTGKQFTLEDILKEILAEIFKWYEVLKKGQTGLIRESYLKNLFKIGEMTLFRKGSKVFQSKIEGIDDFGQLLLKMPSGKKEAFPFKSVEMDY